MVADNSTILRLAQLPCLENPLLSFFVFLRDLRVFVMRISFEMVRFD